jgi:hypothetical protein
MQTFLSEDPFATLWMLFHPVIGNCVYLADSNQRAIFLKSGSRYHYCDTDDVLVYVPFCDDFGPMNLSCGLQFVDILEQMTADFPDHTLVFCVESETRKMTNAEWADSSAHLSSDEATVAD